VAAFDGLAGFPFNAGAYANALWYYIGSQKALSNTGELIAVLEALYQKGLTGELLTCELGGACLRDQRYDEAERWLKLALDTPVDYRDLTRHFDAYYVFLPCQKLCKLYAAKDDRTAAYDYHLRSAAVYPDNPVVLRNTLYFSLSAIVSQPPLNS
jgi:tetratricopeptide (TPR) repeat protein